MRAQGFHEGDLLFGRRSRRRKIRRPKTIDELLGQQVHQIAAIFCGGMNDLHPR